MPKEEWGVKRLCADCGARFYDLGRDPVDCPKCGATYVAEAAYAKGKVVRATAKDDGDDDDALDDDEDDAVIEVDDDDDADDSDDVVVADDDDDDDDDSLEDEDVLLDDDDDDDDDDDLGEFGVVSDEDKET